MSRHPLTLKVMRLARPALTHSQQFPVDYVPKYPSTFSHSARQFVEAAPAQFGGVTSTGAAGKEVPLESFPLTETLSLPRKFGAMYLGETFCAHACITNASQTTVKNVAIQVEIGIGGRMAPLPLSLRSERHEYRQDGPASIVVQRLEPGESINLQITHEIRQLGLHELSWQVDYLGIDGVPDTLRKLFNFRVNNPLVVKTKVNRCRPQGVNESRAIFLEIQVTNATEGTMALERLRFDPDSAYECMEYDSSRLDGMDAPLSPPPESAGAEKQGNAGQGVIWAGTSFMHPGETRQYLYGLTQRCQQVSDTAPSPTSPPLPPSWGREAQQAGSLGRLDILWRSEFGGVGRLQTSQLSQKPQPPTQFPVCMLGLRQPLADEPAGSDDRGGQVALERPFDARFLVRNDSDQAVNLTVAADMARLGSVLLCGNATREVGEVEPDRTREFTFTFIPMSLGVHRIPTFRVSDAYSGTTQQLGGYVADIVVIGDC
ncbi:hypothetical protein EV182_000662 [Spiromyces aspiralis]|uniref:Uncharacterized protein n=1 Tax=Spiromyces aspiralis TaxID=68401 RepID=A0ACC1HY02_9FUNG|nr:hypothetical protein EV182_000662 [Spiromyces aspiralis]